MKSGAVKSRSLVALTALVVAVGAVSFLALRQNRRSAEVAEVAERAAALETARANMRTAFDRRTDFIASQYPSPRAKARWQAALPSIRGLEFREQKDFDAYDRVQSGLASDIAAEIVALKKLKKQPAHLEDWVKRLQAVDRESDQARATYVREARRLRELGASAPSFPAEDQVAR